MIDPKTFYRIVFLTLARDSAVTAFSLADFFANGGKQVLINAAAQYVGYIGAEAVGNTLTPEILLPIFANSKLAAGFIQAANNMPITSERAATVALVFSTAADIQILYNQQILGLLQRS